MVAPCCIQIATVADIDWLECLLVHHSPCLSLADTMTFLCEPLRTVVDMLVGLAAGIAGGRGGVVCAVVCMAYALAHFAFHQRASTQSS